MLFEMMEEIRFLKWDLGIGKTKNDGKSCAFLWHEGVGPNSPSCRSLIVYICDIMVELLTLSAALDPEGLSKSFNVEKICELATKFYIDDFMEKKKLHLRIHVQHYIWIWCAISFWNEKSFNKAISRIGKNKKIFDLSFDWSFNTISINSTCFNCYNCEIFFNYKYIEK